MTLPNVHSLPVVNNRQNFFFCFCTQSHSGEENVFLIWHENANGKRYDKTHTLVVKNFTHEFNS